MNFKEMLLNGQLPENLEVIDAHGHLGVFPGTVGVDGGYIKAVEVCDTLIIHCGNCSHIRVIPRINSPT